MLSSNHLIVKLLQFEKALKAAPPEIAGVSCGWIIGCIQASESGPHAVEPFQKLLQIVQLVVVDPEVLHAGGDSRFESQL